LEIPRGAVIKACNFVATKSLYTTLLLYFPFQIACGVASKQGNSMKIKLIASLIGSSFTSISIAAENIALDDIVVTASRIEQQRSNVLGDISVINREEIERAGAGSITDLLQSQPGVQISTNGGSGKTSNIFLRGTNKDHVVVLIDGLRINSATSGTTSFENIPLAQIEKIEILRGPASSLYGADAIGGVIQIFTRKSENGRPLVHAAMGFGSYGTRTAEAGVGGSHGDTRYNININSFDSNGFSSKRNGIAFDRDNDGYKNLAFNANINHKLSDKNEIGAQFIQSDGTSDYDCYSKSGAGKNGSKCEIEQTLQSYGIYSRNQFMPAWQSNFQIGVGNDSTEDFSGRSPQGVIAYSRFETEQRQLTWQNNFMLPIGTLTLAYDRLEQKIESTSVYNKDSRNNNGYLLSYLADIGNHSLQVSARNDDNSQFGKYTTGGLGYGYNISQNWRITGNYASAFKVPTFNQLYFPKTTGYSGNPNLQPEKSDNTEVSLRYDGGELKSNITIFNNQIENLIVNGDPVKNLNEAKIQGVTFDGSLSITENLSISGNFTTQSPRIIQSNKANEVDNLLDRRSNRYGAVKLLYTNEKLQSGIEITGASSRYNDSANTKVMDGYALVNLTASYKLNPEWKLEARANNILDKNYVLAFTGNAIDSVPYNTAGSNVFVGLRYQMKP
jgi:vitamin B12 transporter